MALADRRPIELSKVGSPSSPTFDATSMGLMSSKNSLNSSSVSALHSINEIENNLHVLPVESDAEGIDFDVDDVDVDIDADAEVDIDLNIHDNDLHLLSGNLDDLATGDINLISSNDDGTHSFDESHAISNQSNAIMDSPNKQRHESNSIPISPRVKKQLKQSTPENLDSPSSRLISPDSLMNGDRKSSSLSSSRGSSPQPNPSINASSGIVPKKPKNPSRVPIATGFSTTIPVTGEKPRPEQKGDLSLEDDVLYAIFLILYEKDPEGKGMTVKQICDILVERHPEMASLSTKTSNLVSAKLNAYVKRVEKGDVNLKYALSREWADASPKRMVYVYRGLLAEDFHLHVKNAMQKQQLLLQPLSSQSDSHNQILLNGHNSHSQSSRCESLSSGSPTLSKLSNKSALIKSSGLTSSSTDLTSLSADPQIQFKTKGLTDSSFELPKTPNHTLKQRRQTMFDLGTKHTLLDSTLERTNLFVPYSSLPVTASLNELNGETKKLSLNLDDELELANGDRDEEDDDFEVFGADDEDEDQDVFVELIHKNGKRSKSMSYLSCNKKSKFLTAAAAAPRISRQPAAHNPSAVAAAAALHAAALEAISSHKSNEGSGKTLPQPNKKWLNVVRSGFLTQEIGAPEDTSLSDIDKFFG
ncbi:uncharacterized protein KQ657_003760 [Scheffersomyces spartinae]|uniref:GDS1 winged helix domain-containing protein n=1 Tax=Scheffersomyces spartinae TaxID=45513 RepID=A0A9P7VDC1_9ASCO|nr:uncharacterized protein KQ657_003760 [Scheffersomyces spartinae]KAG7195234.1 hypothetical protein KQ657_003760 [Scheffersomyces spartinae]